MTPPTSETTYDDPFAVEVSLDDYVRAFEQAYAHGGGADLAAYLPPADHPLHAAVLRELVRVDLEYGWERGRPRDLADYLRDFPALAADPEGLRGVAFEEFRLRLQAGQDPSAEEYLSRYGVRLDPVVGTSRSLGPPRRGNAPSRGPADPDRPGPRLLNGDGHSLGRMPAPLRRDASGGGPVPNMPEVGDDFLGFRLIGELGQGSFGRVYLARQGDLADRPVVLKVTADGSDEARTLAQLQHDNIVPVYSRHREGRLRAVCMPYLGAVTLRDVVEDLKVQGALPDSGRGLLSSLGKSSVRKGVKAFPAPSPPGPPPSASASQARAPRRAERDADDTRSMLGKLTYVEAVVWMGARLADGLAHAHERGILHRDMKPANILLTDDGRPMLLDFNLAEDLKQRGPESGADGAVGGTLPYMAPEHLAAFQSGGRGVDARSDLFAFGVILFEMLTGRPPFPVRDGMRPGVIAAMIADRGGVPPRLRPWNPAVSPAVESVVRRCLAPDPAGRYATARELGEDLRLHLAHRPLRHAPDPSRVERASKWARRNRRRLVAAAVLVVGAAVVAGFAAALGARSHELARFEARAALQRFHEGSTRAQNLLDSWIVEVDPAGRAEGLKAARAALDEFHARTDPGPSSPAPWWERPPAAALAAADRDRLRGEAGEVLLMAARALSDADGARAALKDNERAERCYDPGAAPWALWSQRADLLRTLGDAGGARLASARAEAAPLAAARDYFLKSSELARKRRFAEALALCEKAVSLAPRQHRFWLGAGNLHLCLKHNDQASACYNACIALRPDDPTAWADRGKVALLQGKWGQALADLDQALALRRDDPDLLTNRALAFLGMGRATESVRTFDRAIERGYSQTRVYFMRSRARKAAGDLEGARLDHRKALDLEPADETSWVARALARDEGRDFRGAVADLDRALAINPESLAALQTKAYVLGERLGDTAGALAASDRAVALRPDWAAARGGRGVLLARLGRRTAALADAEELLRLDPSPYYLHQAAGIYALTSRQTPGDRVEALALLASSLKRAPGRVDQIDADHDLDPVRSDPAFHRMVAGARAASRAARAGTLPRDPTNDNSL